MAEYRERSGLFKFFYVILRVITFPLYVVIYVLKHPLWVLLLLLLVFCVGIYYPLVEGKKLADVPEWYKNKYAEMRVNIVKKAVESGKLGFVSQDLQDQIKKEVAEENRPKGENYNSKVIREDKIEEKTSDLKKRGGFKKKNVAANTVAEDDDAKDILEQGEEAAGGLADILRAYQKHQEENSLSPAASESAKPVVSAAESALEKEPLPAVKDIPQQNGETKVLPEVMPELLPDVLDEKKENANKVDDSKDNNDSDEFDLF